MKTKLLIVGMLLLSLVVLSGCSEIPSKERVAYCEELGLKYSSELNNKWECSIWIDDKTYQFEKFIDELNEEYDLVPKNNSEVKT